MYNKTINNKESTMNAFKVLLDGLHIDTVYFLPQITIDEAWHSLVEHDDYNPNITLEFYKRVD